MGLNQRETEKKVAGNPASRRASPQRRGDALATRLQESQRRHDAETTRRRRWKNNVLSKLKLRTSPARRPVQDDDALPTLTPES